MLVSERITRKLMRQGVVKEEEFALYQYSINALIEYCCNIIITIMLGVFMGKIYSTLLFLVIVIPIRSFIGGCHAKTALGCFCMSILVYLIAILGPDYILVNSASYISVCISILFGVGVCFLAPVMCKENMLDRIRYRKMKKCSLVSIILLIILCIVFGFLDLKAICVEIALIMLYFFATLIIQKMKDRREVIR